MIDWLVLAIDFKITTWINYFKINLASIDSETSVHLEKINSFFTTVYEPLPEGLCF